MTTDTDTLMAHIAVIKRATEAGLTVQDLAAAAFEAAAEALQNVADNWDCGHMESRLCDCARDAEQWGIAADEVRALTPAHAKAALDRMLRQAKAEGMREAARVINTGGLHTIQSRVDAILSRAKDMEAGNG